MSRLIDSPQPPPKPINLVRVEVPNEEHEEITKMSEEEVTETVRLALALYLTNRKYIRTII